MKLKMYCQKINNFTFYPKFITFHYQLNSQRSYSLINFKKKENEKLSESNNFQKFEIQRQKDIILFCHLIQIVPFSFDTLE